jgi:hypothetical protein
MVHKKRGVGERWSETNGLNIGRETLKPSPGSLFETIQRFLKKTNMIRSRGILKTKRLLTVNFFLKRAMEESIFDVELVNRPLRRDGYTEYYANGAGLNNRRESFIIVNPVLLRKTATNPASFVARKTTVGVEFLMKTPLTRDNVCTRRARNELPGVILKKGRKLLTHGSSPIWV